MGTFIAIVCVSCLGPASAPDQADQEKKLIEQARNRGIRLEFVVNAEGNRVATARLKLSKEAVKGMKLLHNVGTGYLWLHAEIPDAGLTAEFLKELAQFQNLRGLELQIRGTLKASEVETIVAFKSIESLSLDYVNITPAQVTQLHGLKASKNLSYLGLRYAEPMPEAVQQLKLALPQVKRFDLREDIGEHMRNLVRITAKDDHLAKLKKQKLLVAIRSVQGNHSERGLSLNLSEVVQSSRMLKEALFDLDDPQLALSLASEYARLTQWLRATEVEWHKTINSPSSEASTEVEYIYLDSQIWQVALEKKAKAGR